MAAVIDSTISNGSNTSPGDIVENLLKNCRIAIPRKKLFTRLIGSHGSTWESRDLHIRNASELLKEIPGDESKDGIFGGDNLVRGVGVFLLNSTPVVEVVFGNVLVNIDSSLWSRLPLPREKVLNLKCREFIIPAQEGIAGG